MTAASGYGLLTLHGDTVLDAQPAGGDLWVALAWCVGLLAVAYAWANATYRRRLR